MKNVSVFEKSEFYKIKDFQKEKPSAVMGIVYAIEYSGGYSKIGMSSIPADRTSVLRHYISDYMQKSVDRIMISQWHTNYRENEKELHKAFSDCRVPNTELFSVVVEEVVDFIESGGVLFENRSEEILEEIKRKSDALIEFGKSVMSSDYDCEKKEKFVFKDMYEDMLRKSNGLTDEILFTTRSFIDDYRAALEDNMSMELMRIKSYFVDKWIEYELICGEDVFPKHGGRKRKVR